MSDQTTSDGPAPDRSAEPGPPDAAPLRERRVPRFALAFLVVAALLVGALVVFGDDLVSPVTDDLLDLSDVPEERTYDRDLADLGHPDGIWLSGFPSYASFTVPVPTDSAIVGVSDVVLRAEQDVSPDEVVMLRVSVEGRRVRELTLDAGRDEAELHIPVQPGDTERGSVRIAVELAGDLPAQLCQDDRALGAVVHLTSDSGFRAELEEPIRTVRDAVATAPADALLALPDGDDQAWVELATTLGVALTHRGYAVAYADGDQLPAVLDGAAADATTRTAAADDDSADPRLLVLLGPEDELRRRGWEPADGAQDDQPVAVGRIDDGQLALAVTLPEPDAVVPLLTTSALTLGSATSVDPRVITTAGLSGDRVGVEQLGLDTAVRDVRRYQSWDVDYSVADLPGGRAPRTLDVDLQLPDGPDDYVDVVHAELNGTLVSSTRIEAPGQVRVTVPLPGELQLLRNRVEVTLQRERADGGCLVDDDPYPVQLLSSSALWLGGDGAAVGGFVALPAAFDEGVEVRLPASAAGEGAADALGRLVPVLAEVVSSDQPLQYRWDRATDPAGAPTMPFVALDQVPEGSSVPILLADDELVARAGGDVTLDVTGLGDVTVVEVAEGAPGAPLGLVVLTTGDGPALQSIRLGQEEALIVPVEGVAVEVLPDGTIRDTEAPRFDAAPLS